MEGFGSFIWIFFIFMALQPVLQRRLIDSARLRLMGRIEKRLGVRLITLIHRQETMSLLGFPLMKYIDLQDSEAILRAIRLTDDRQPIDLVLHTPGGLVLASLQIARALKEHPARTRVIVPHMAMSGGTLIAMAADEIVMDPHAVLGPVDPQIGQQPAASILQVLETKPVSRIDDKTVILADVARKAIDQLHGAVKELLGEKIPAERLDDVAHQLSAGRWTHDYPITCDQARAIGLTVSCDMPQEYYQLMNLYPQPVRQESTVQYLPQEPRPAPGGSGGRDRT